MSSTDPTFPLSLEGLQRRYDLSSDMTDRLSTFAGMLAFDPLAPTTVTHPAAVRDDHLADALVGLDIPAIRAAQVVADLGAGAGVPGIPLAIALPAATVNLIEGNGKKREFMQNALDSLELGNAVVPPARAELWSAGLGTCDVVTARALASLDVVAEYAAPLLRVGGVLVAWRGRRDPAVEAAAARAAAVLGLELDEPVRVEPYRGADNRHLHVLRKVAETPARFPRRDGVARKRPLGAI
jgi:16S rRNA (guanine527-N7)-methyltransferase